MLNYLKNSAKDIFQTAGIMFFLAVLVVSDVLEMENLYARAERLLARFGVESEEAAREKQHD